MMPVLNKRPKPSRPGLNPRKPGAHIMNARTEAVMISLATLCIVTSLFLAGLMLITIQSLI